VRYFHGRPFQVIYADRFTQPLYQAIADDSVRRIPLPIGTIDQFSDNTDLRESLAMHKRLRLLYE
jgi:hypothetical protein